MKRQVIGTKEQKSKITLAVTFKTEYGRIKYEEKITEIQTGGDQDLTLPIEQRERGQYNSFSGSGKI